MVSASPDRSPRSFALRAASLLLVACVCIGALANRLEQADDSKPVAEAVQGLNSRGSVAVEAPKSQIVLQPTQDTANPRRSDARSEHDSTSPSPQGRAATGEVDREELLHGILREISRDRFLSPAGLIYGPGSAEGHRLEHLRRHIDDDPRREGSHGVFDGGMEGALKTIDTAYQRALSGQRTTTRTDGPRTIHTIDLGKRIGYVGGAEGQRRGNPMARRVRLVLEGKVFVTGFPL
jgi:hypothetical protein